MTTALEGVRGQHHAPAAPYSRDRCGKSAHPPELDPRTVPPLAIRYTDYAIGNGIDVLNYLELGRAELETSVVPLVELNS